MFFIFFIRKEKDVKSMMFYLFYRFEKQKSNGCGCNHFFLIFCFFFLCGAFDDLQTSVFTYFFQIQKGETEHDSGLQMKSVEKHLGEGGVEFWRGNSGALAKREDNLCTTLSQHQTGFYLYVIITKKVNLIILREV